MMMFVGTLIFIASFLLFLWYLIRRSRHNAIIRREEFPPQQYARFPQAAMYEAESHAPKAFHTFINTMIIPSFFHKQNTSGDQFAVLILVKVDIKNISDVVLYPHDRWGNPLVNDRYQRSPNSAAEYNNYVVARPEYNSHAETAILDQIDKLWSAFFTSNGHPPKHIVLYSWIFPCTDCTETIINTLSCARYKYMGKIVAYKLKNWTRLSPKENRVNKQLLLNAGIKTVQV